MSRTTLRARLAVVIAFALGVPSVLSADNLIKDLSRTPLAEVAAGCDAHDWVACRELGDRAHYGKGVTQDLDAAGRFYARAKEYADASDKFRGMANALFKTLELDRRCAERGARIAEPGSAAEVTDCAVDYYEAKASGDFKEAVACAQRAQQAETLAMLYANGHGVPRDLDRAIRAACEYRDVSAERDGMLETLFRMKADGGGPEFDFCAHATSGHTAERCSIYRASTIGREDDLALATARARWTPAAVLEWARLEPMAAAYFDAEAGAVTYGDRLGTGFHSEIEGELTDLRHAFTTMIAGTDAFRPESVKEAGRLAEVDRELNAQYAKSLGAIGDPEEKEVARAAERAWIRYRDAVVAFFQAELAGRFPPDAVAQAMRARLTRERLERLRTP